MSEASITRISGPVLRAVTDDVFHINEAVFVGDKKLLGEVIRVERNAIVAQAYEDTSGLRPGDTVLGNGMPLSVKLGPALLGNIFDGLLRPLTLDLGDYVQPGMQAPPPQGFEFTPGLKVGDTAGAGSVLGSATGTGGLSQSVLIPPNISGVVIDISPQGHYDDEQTICTVRGGDGTQHQLAMSHHWPIRDPRPVAQRLPTSRPLFTGQRILDSIFPLACGGRAAMPGGFGTGKTVLQETLSKWCDADIIVYVGCGERGNEMAGVLHDLPALEDPRTGRPLMERTLIIANTSNMPVAAREASIYTAVTVAEYFRDQGLRVSLMADSTSRWAEALREVSGRLGEIPGEGGYPAYLSSRLADFYERAAHVRTLGGEPGSLSIIGAVSPPSADFSEPVTTHTKRYVRVFWALDSTRAQARFYPAIHPLLSYSGDIDDLLDYWRENNHPHWLEQRRRFLTLLEQQMRLERMARIVGKDALPPRQQHVLLCAELINDGFLRQSAYSEIDRYCSPERQAAMMQLLTRFIELSEQAIEQRVDFELIGNLPILRRLRRMSEEIGEHDMDKFETLRTELEQVFSTLAKQEPANAG
ncbi:MAG: V-type ATP synthase subunit A [Gammaproteobacteria bacterium]|nr:V-type ATP synthase subunit A [Gammaproteobacteria bacterium]MDH5172978.1 V-type ATP synthase subunit A [Gammaproteobacteria bacterium]